MTIAAAQVDTTAWWISLGVGLVVALVLIALLALLYTTVRQVERNVITLWDTATTVARNTATTWMLRDTAQIIKGLNDEVRRHQKLSDRSSR